LTPIIFQLAKQDLEKLPLKNNTDSRELVLRVRARFLGFEIWAQE